MRGQRHAPAVFTPWKDPVPIVREAGWAPGPVWTVAENLAATGIRPPDRPARNQSLKMHRMAQNSVSRMHSVILTVIFRMEPVNTGVSQLHT